MVDVEIDARQGSSSPREKTALTEEQERAFEAGSTSGTVLGLVCPTVYNTASVEPDRLDVALARPIIEGTLANSSPFQPSPKVNLRLDRFPF